MLDFFALIGIISAIAGVGMLLILLIALINGQIPLNSFGLFLGAAPFVLFFIAAILLTHRKT